ncbi:MAG: 4Fe-4S dicluster domain-containing protein [Ktedonobacteraceae bacterium]
MKVEHGRFNEAPIQAGARSLLNAIAPLRKETPLPTQPALGFFTDTSICIGCKACEVACKQWNQLPATDPVWSGTSYDNTRQLGATTWRHVQFIEQVRRRQPEKEQRSATHALDLPLFTETLDKLAEAQANGTIPATPPGTALPFFNTDRWLMHSDVCKHCANAPCQEACPTGAIIRTEFDTVYVQQDICNGCGYCVVACPFGVIARDEKGDHQAHKCTLCYDRLKDGMQPACAKACPTTSIVFGEVEQLKQQAQARLGTLHEHGVEEARLYGADDTILEGGLHSFFLLLDKPEVYNLPQNPPRPSNNVAPASFWAVLAATAIGLLGVFFFKQD